MKRQIHKFLNASRVGSVFLFGLIFISIIGFTFETEYTDNIWLRYLSLSVAMLFLVEYLLRIWTADMARPDLKNPRIAYIFSFYGIVDLLAFLPVLLAPSISGSVLLRSLRFIRLFQIMKFKPLTKGLRRIWAAIYSSRFELVLSLGVSIFLIFIGAVLMYLVEGSVQPDTFGSVPRALWWSMATLTTVGYGDVYPITAAGKILASLIAIVGIGAVAMPAGILAAAFSSTRPEKAQEQ